MKVPFLSTVRKRNKKSLLFLLSSVTLALVVLYSILSLIFIRMYHFNLGRCTLLSVIIDLILHIFSASLLALYSNKLQYDTKNTTIISLIFISLIIICFLKTLDLSLVVHYYYDFELLFDISNIIFILSCVLSLISISKGLLNKPLVFVTILVGLVCELLALINILQIIEYLPLGGWIAILITTSLIELISSVLIYIILFLLIKNYKKTNLQERFSSEQLLKLLKEKYETGTISEEDYQKERTEIINSL